MKFKFQSNFASKLIKLQNGTLETNFKQEGGVKNALAQEARAQKKENKIFELKLQLLDKYQKDVKKALSILKEAPGAKEVFCKSGRYSYFIPLTWEDQGIKTMVFKSPLQAIYKMKLGNRWSIINDKEKQELSNMGWSQSVYDAFICWIDPFLDRQYLVVDWAKTKERKERVRFLKKYLSN